MSCEKPPVWTELSAHPGTETAVSGCLSSAGESGCRLTYPGSGTAGNVWDDGIGCGTTEASKNVTKLKLGYSSSYYVMNER